MNNNELLKQAMNVVAERHDFKDFIYLVPHADSYAKRMELIAEVASEYAEAYHAAKLEQEDNDIDDDGFCPECGIGLNNREIELGFCSNCKANWK